ncbi:hypothetical protein B5X24_HaOG209577 [Helicoverpa armigera]|nr:hypothetical protein B5X24_HaOG209577 [Helicoverpa armigera]
MLPINKTNKYLIFLAIQRKWPRFCIIAILLFATMVFIPTYFGVRKILRLKINLPARTLGKLEKDDKVDFRSQETQDYLINTPGCYIPNYAKHFKYNESFPKSSYMCNPRAVMVYPQDNNTIQFQIDERQMKKYNDGLSWYQCCYKFVTQSDIPGHEHDQLSYTKCKEFKNGTIIMIDQEVITVTCYDKKHFVMYTDAYIVVKINYSSPKTDITKSWNVLMIGIDSMSRTRFFDTMPRTSAFIKKEKWLDYKGYHMVHPETSKTLLSILTGRNMSLSSCATSLSDCVDNFIWQKYKDAGYKTAFGETNLGISNTLSSGFRYSPTDHFMRPLFLTGERHKNQILCTQKKPSTTHLLDYAKQFFRYYKNTKTFGMFWINSDTFTLNTIPSLLDGQLEYLFTALKYSKILSNTFVIFFSDHGNMFGKMQLPVGSYYNNRLPMLFIWVPLQFRRENLNIHFNLRENQERLVSPYDLYVTLADILELSTSAGAKTLSEACPLCTSLFEKKSPNTRCTDSGIPEYWCSCHNMTKVDDVQMLENSVTYAVARINDIGRSVKTIPCTSCAKLRFPSVVRSHVYYIGAKTYNIVVIKMSPNSLIFEAVVVYQDKGYELLSLRSLVQYNRKGNCAVNASDRPFCVCLHDYGSNTKPKPFIIQYEKE